LLPVVLLLLLPVGCASPDISEQTVSAPPDLGDGWAVGTPIDAGFDVDALLQLTLDIRGGQFPNTHAALIEYDGRLVFEEYFEGSDERWGTPIAHRVIGRDSLHDLRSVSKSVTAAALGIALGSGYEEALARPVVSFFPDFDQEAESRAVTLHQALTMTSGLEWNEMSVPYTSATNDEIRTYSVADPVAYVLSRPVRDEPGSAWYYNGGITQVLAGIVQQLTGQALDDFTAQALFVPLGITSFEWLGSPTWDPPMPAAMSGLRLSARDLARIGSVYLHGGRWNGEQVVPAGWVERSMTRHVPEIGIWSNGGMWGYGYQWWTGRFPDGPTVVAAVGNGNQRLFILPEERLVVTVLAGEYNSFEGHSEALLLRILAARRPNGG